MKNVTIETTRL